MIRLRSAPTEAELAKLNAEFADICLEGGIEVSEPLQAEVSGDDNLDLARLVLRFDMHSHGRLRLLINALNTLPSLA